MSPSAICTRAPWATGILNGSLGVGAVVGATLLARIRRRVEATTLLTITSLYYVLALVLLALVHTPGLVILTLLGAGFCWTASMSTLNVSVQLAAPSWVSARALGLYLMTFQGGMALGSVTWGAVAERTSVSTALLSAAVCMAATLPFLLRIPVLKGVLPDLTPYKWKRPVPTLAMAPDPEDGPVRISIDYRVKPEDLNAFTQAIYQLKGVRLRDGAIRWAIYRDANDPEHMNETFIMESWLDYLRSRERTTAADSACRERVWALHTGPEPPKITHQLWLKETDPASPQWPSARSISVRSSSSCAFADPVAGLAEAVRFTEITGPIMRNLP